MAQEDEPADDFGEEAQFSQEMQNSGEVEGNSFGGSSFSMKAEDVDEEAVEGSNEGKSVCVETDAQGRNYIIHAEDNIIDCKAGVPCAQVEVNEHRIIHEKENPESYEPTPQETVCSFQHFSGNKSKEGSHSMPFETACFCEQCMSDKDDFWFRDKKSKHDTQLHCIKTEIMNGDSDLHLSETTNQRQFHTDFGNVSDGVELDTHDGTAQATTRPNTEGAGAGSPRKQGMARQAVSRPGKGEVSFFMGLP